jgi:putative two-component system response regulator
MTSDTMDADKILVSPILIVEDEPANILLLKRTLTGKGYTNLTSVDDPREAVAAFEAAEPRLVLLDINMPHMDGFDVLEALKEKFGPEIAPVLFLTAQTDRSTRVRALEAGARDFITKPFDRAELLARIHNMLELQLALDYIAAEKEILEERVHERTQEIYQTRLNIVRHLGRASEYRDNETGLHIIRMSQISRLLALKLGLSETEADLILNASPMHDVGKIGIPDGILLKPGKLDPDEWEIMKTHTIIGAEILTGSDADLLVMAREIAITHHEKWDGSGYPNGLAGEDIPLVGRITALADVFDALTSARPYKKAWSIEEALDLIKDQRGKHFDPSLVDCFLENLEEIVGIRDRFAEPAE